MKKLLLIVLFCLSYTFSFSQDSIKKSPNLRINAYALYAFDDKVDAYYSGTSYYEGKIKGGLQWGVGLEYMARPEYGVEISYYNLNSDAPITYYDYDAVIDNVKTTTFNLTSNYIMVGGNRYVKNDGKIEPYGGLQFGVAILDVENPDKGYSDSATKFAWGARLGTNVWLSPKLGIKLQAALLSAVQSVGGSLYFGTGGAGAGVSTYSSLLQFSLGGGVTFNVGD